MTKYFTIAAPGLTADQEKSLAKKWAEFGWWHGVSGFWLFRDHKDVHTAATLRDAIRTVAPSARVMVLEVQPTTWSSLSIDPSNREWLRQYWPPEGA